MSIKSFNDSVFNMDAIRQTVETFKIRDFTKEKLLPDVSLKILWFKLL